MASETRTFNKPVRRLLAVNLNYLGDALFTTPALAILKARFPDAELDVLAGERAVAILEGNPHITRLLPRPPHGGAGRAVALKNALQTGGYDAVFLFQSTLSNALLAWAARVPRRIGFAQEGCGPFLTDAVPGRQAGEHVVDAYARLAHAGQEWAEDATTDYRLSVALGPQERAFADDFFARHDRALPVVGLVIGATRPQKRWPEEYFARFADKLWTVGGMSSVLLGGPDEKQAAERIMAQAKSPLVSAVGQTTEKELAALIGRLGVVVSGDSGPLHIATAVNTPVVALFGSTDPADTGPWRPTENSASPTNALPPIARATVLYDALACAPCRKTPTCGGTFDCLRVLTPERVFDAACDLLQTAPARVQLPVLSPQLGHVPSVHSEPPRAPVIHKHLGGMTRVQVQSIVVLTKHRFMGDTIVAAPLLRATRRAFPDARITLLTGRAAATALQNCPYTDQIVTYDPRGTDSNHPADGQQSLQNALKQSGNSDDARPDLCLVADRSFRSAAIAWKCGGRIRAGFATERRAALLTHPIPYDPEAREIECYLDILRAVAPERAGEPPYDPTPELWLTPEEPTRGAEILREALRESGASDEMLARPLVGIQPGATYPGKQWPFRNFARVADFVARQNAVVVLVGSGDDEIRAATKMKAAMEIQDAPLIDLTGKTKLRETMGVLSHLGLFIGNDTGVNHIAASLDVPTVGLFGPTPARKWGNHGPCSAVLTAPNNDLSRWKRPR